MDKKVLNDKIGLNDIGPSGTKRNKTKNDNVIKE